LHEGWLDTGDLAEYVDDHVDPSHRSIRVLGRADDTIVLANGYKVQPLPIEQAFQVATGIQRCVLVGNGRPFPIMLANVFGAESHANLLQADLNAIARDAWSSEFPKYALPHRTILIQEPWCHENGLANFKGGLLRAKIEQRYSDSINDAYRTASH
jgi:long-chain acyl-CoA synthetase